MAKLCDQSINDPRVYVAANTRQVFMIVRRGEVLIPCRERRERREEGREGRRKRRSYAGEEERTERKEGGRKG